MVDLDVGRVVYSVGDEGTILPRKLIRALRSVVELVNSMTKPGEPARNLLTSEFFVRMWVELIGHYNNHIITQPDGGKEFKVGKPRIWSS